MLFFSSHSFSSVSFLILCIGKLSLVSSLINFENKICSNKTSIGCELFNSCKNYNFSFCNNTNELLLNSCSSDTTISSLPECSIVKQSCNSSNCQTQFLIPTQQNITTFTQSVCSEMPTMNSCKSCDLSNSNNCTSLISYSKLCLEMPSMTQVYFFNKIGRIKKSRISKNEKFIVFRRAKKKENIKN